MEKGIVLYMDSLNIGDDIQGYAASKLIDDDFEVLDRENLNNPDIKGPVKLICNGWFMDQPGNWPPTPNIDPLLISFHIGKFNTVKKALLKPELKPYYQKHGPIGCRDFETLRLFKSMKVDAYYSGCLTLTLPKSHAVRSEEILVVDGIINNLLQPEYAKKVLLKLIPQSYHKQVKFLTHVRSNNKISAEQRLKDAELTLDKFARAKLVITSRIHCALPCLALGTPVFFVDFGYSRQRNRDRFEGILNLMHTVKPNLPFHGSRRIDKILKLFGFHKLFLHNVKPLSINWNNPDPNPEHHLDLVKQLKMTVADFLKNHDQENDKLKT